jgi:hypothetical protein
VVQLLVYVLIEIEDVAPVFVDEFGDEGDEAGLVWAVD